MTTHPINPLARGGFLVTVKRDGRATKVKYLRTYEEVEEYMASIRDRIGTLEITDLGAKFDPTGGAE